jgi:hypothetical protein
MRFASIRHHLNVLFVVSIGMIFGFSSADAADDVDLHDLTWYVHVDLVTVTETLPFWQNVLDEQLAEANDLVEGANGPSDTACCARLSGAASLTMFGTPGDGLDMIDSETELNSLNTTFGGSGSNAFLVDSITYCGGASPNSIGCAPQPGCSGNGGDDPDLWMVVTADALDTSVLPLVIAHERGHNACLEHTDANPCQIMQATINSPGMGGCFTATECANFRDARTEISSGLECDCHAGGGGPAADETVCASVASGICSGGLCGSTSGDAAIRLMASAHPGSAGIPAPDDALAFTALTADWTDLGPITPIAEDVQGLAYSSDAEILYGVIPTTGNDSIVTIDSTTGDVIETVGAIANGAAELVAMAYDPGATPSPSDDRLILLEISAAGGAAVWLDPALPSTLNSFGTLPFQASDDAEFKGLAYDSVQDKLFVSSPFGPGGIYEIDLSTCSPSPCSMSQIPGGDPLFVLNGSLTYSPDTQMLYQLGTTFDGVATFYNVIDPTNGTTIRTLNVDPLTPGGFAAVPEPGPVAGLAVGCAGLALARRRASLADQSPRVS